MAVPLRTRPRGSTAGGGSRPQPQLAFAAQNLEDLAFYDIDGNQDCGECGRKVGQKQHFA